MDVPVYLFTGFLESGKSSMMKEDVYKRQDLNCKHAPSAAEKK